MLRYQSGSTPTAFRFTGQRLDAGTGLYFYQSRYYDPALGRFLQPDTIVPNPGDPQSFNRFAYVLNNPLRYTDPMGHFTEEAIAGYYGVESVEDIWWWARIGIGAAFEIPAIGMLHRLPTMVLARAIAVETGIGIGGAFMAHWYIDQAYMKEYDITVTISSCAYIHYCGDARELEWSLDSNDDWYIRKCPFQ